MAGERPDTFRSTEYSRVGSLLAPAFAQAARASRIPVSDLGRFSQSTTEVLARLRSMQPSLFGTGAAQLARLGLLSTQDLPIQLPQGAALILGVSRARNLPTELRDRYAVMLVDPTDEMRDGNPVMTRGIQAATLPIGDREGDPSKSFLAGLEITPDPIPKRFQLYPKTDFFVAQTANPALR